MILVSKSPHDGSRKNYETVYRYAEKTVASFFPDTMYIASLALSCHGRVVVT